MNGSQPFNQLCLLAKTELFVGGLLSGTLIGMIVRVYA
jgi:hypothetical protein